MADSKSVFEVLDELNVSDKIEQKNGLNYLSWAWAWKELKKLYPDANYTVYENKDGLNYHTDGRTCWVKCGVTVQGVEQVEMLPVMDFRNKSIPANAVTSVDVIKSIQRCVTKAIGRHGLGLYIYAGEDLPENVSESQKPQMEVQPKQQQRPTQHTVDSELNRLKAQVQDAINRGDLQGKVLNRAIELMAKNDKEGLKNCINYLVNKEIEESA